METLENESPPTYKWILKRTKVSNAYRIGSLWGVDYLISSDRQSVEKIAGRNYRSAEGDYEYEWLRPIPETRFVPRFVDFFCSGVGLAPDPEKKLLERVQTVAIRETNECPTCGSSLEEKKMAKPSPFSVKDFVEVTVQNCVVGCHPYSWWKHLECERIWKLARKNEANTEKLQTMRLGI